MEIEKKFLIRELPANLESYPHSTIEQAYLNRLPVIRIRQRDDNYILTYKSGGLMVRQEEEMPLTKEAYLHLKKKADGNIIRKKRYLIPYGAFTIELDVFAGEMSPLIMAEVEFDSKEQAEAFVPPAWFGEEVTFDKRYQNVNMALGEDTQGA